MNLISSVPVSTYSLNSLPPEVNKIILSQVNEQTLQSIVLVSSAWNRVGLNYAKEEAVSFKEDLNYLTKIGIVSFTNEEILAINADSEGTGLIDLNLSTSKKIELVAEKIKGRTDVELLNLYKLGIVPQSNKALIKIMVIRLSLTPTPEIVNDLLNEGYLDRGLKILQSPSFQKKLYAPFKLLLKKLERTSRIEFEKAAIEIAQIHDSQYNGKDTYLGRVAVVIAKNGHIEKAISLINNYNFPHPDAGARALGDMAEQLAIINPEKAMPIIDLINNDWIRSCTLKNINIIKTMRKQ